VTGIYEIRCTANDRRYIGSAKNIRHRWNVHRSDLELGRHGNGHLLKAWRKYGAEAFLWVVLEECGLDVLIEREQFYLDCAYAVNEVLFNLCPTAGNSLGHKWTPEQRAYKADSVRGFHHTDAAKRKISEGARGRIVSLEERAARSARMMGMTYSVETRAKMSRAKKGRKLPLATRAKMSTSARKVQAERARLRTHCKQGHEFTPENTFLRTDSGARGCRECKREISRRYEARLKRG